MRNVQVKNACGRPTARNAEIKAPKRKPSLIQYSAKLLSHPIADFSAPFLKSIDYFWIGRTFR